MESSGVGSAGFGVHVDVHGERVILWVVRTYHACAWYLPLAVFILSHLLLLLECLLSLLVLGI